MSVRTRDRHLEDSSQQGPSAPFHAPHPMVPPTPSRIRDRPLKMPGCGRPGVASTERTGSTDSSFGVRYRSVRVFGLLALSTAEWATLDRAAIAARSVPSSFVVTSGQ